MGRCYLQDVMGIFTGVGTERQHKRNGSTTKMNVIELESDGYCFIISLICSGVIFVNFYLEINDLIASVVIDCIRLKMECALFGPYVDDLNSFLATGEIQGPVVVLQFAKVKSFQGIYCYIGCFCSI